MARSVGEAAANGLESGLNLGMSIANQRRQQDRQDILDAQHNEDRQRAIMRQQMADQGAALDAQLKDLNSEGQAMEASGTPPTPEQQQAFSTRVNAVRQARDAHLSKLSGVVLEDAHRGALEDLKALDASGGDISKVRNLTRAITVGTGQDPKVYLRGQDGSPAPIEQAGMAMMQGIQTGDKASLVQGANVIFGPKLQEGLGKPSPHGGTIVRKEIVDVVPDPKSGEKDPRYIPVLKVYVRKDDFNGPGDPDRGGATSSYTAPLTEGRATGDDAKVKALSLKDVMDFVGHNLQLTEQINTPEGLQKLQQDQQASTFDPSEYLQALQRVGIQPNKVTTKDTIIPMGGKVLRTTTDKQGRVVSEKTIDGNPRPEPKNRQEELMQAKLDSIDEAEAAGQIDADQAERERTAVRSGIRPTAAKTGAGPTSTQKADMAVMGRRLQTLKDERLSLESQRKTALEEYKLASHEASKKDAAAAKAAYDAKVAALEQKGADLDKRIKKINEDLDAYETKAAKDEDSGPTLDSGSPRKVSKEQQASLDSDAQRIYQQELTTERDRLTKMQAEAKPGNAEQAAAIERKKGDIAALEREVKRVGGAPARAASAPPAAKSSTSQPAKPASKAEYDALPVGAVYERDGKLYRKK